MIYKTSLLMGFISVAFLLAIGLTSTAQALATAVVFVLLFSAIIKISKDSVLAISIILARIFVVSVAVLWIQPFLEAETGTDAQMYHSVGMQISRAILNSGALPSTGEVWGTNAYAMFTGAWYALCGASEIRIMLFNTFIAAIGSLMIYRAFIESFGEPRRLLKYLILFDPSLLYWSSIHGKDPSIFFFLGLAFQSLSRLFLSGRPPDLVFYLLALLGMFLIRPQTAFTCGVSVLVTLLILRLRAPFPNAALKFCFRLSLLVAALSSVVLFEFYGAIGGASSADLLPRLSSVAESLSFGGTAVDIPSFSTWGDLLAYLPLGMGVVLFRPFPWEQGNTFIRLASLHQLVPSLGCILVMWGVAKRYLIGEARKVRGEDQPPNGPLRLFLLDYCLVFVLLYAVISGNVGTLVRERIQFISFVWCAGFAMNTFLLVPSRASVVANISMKGSVCES